MIDFAKPLPWIEVPGDHEPRAGRIKIYGEPGKLPMNPLEYLTELSIVSYWTANEYLPNSQSFSCSRLNNLRIRNFNETARDRVKHLRKRLSFEGVETGSRSYRLNLALGTVIIARRVLQIPGLDKRIADKLRQAFDHALATAPSVDPRRAALFLELSGASIREHGR